MKKMITLTAVILMMSASLSTAYAAENLDSTPDISRWGVDLSFGNQPYMEYSTRISLLTPHIFGSENTVKWRMSLDYVGRVLEFNAEDINEFGISFETNSPVYKDLVYSFTKFGVSVVDVDDLIFDDTLISLPVSFGLQVVFRNTERLVMSYFIDYRFSLFNTYDEDDSPVNLRQEVLFSGTTSFGLRMLF